MGYRLCRILYMSDCIQISSFKRGKIVCVVTGHNFNHMGTSQILKLIFHMAPCTVYYANHIRYFSCSFNYQFSPVQFSRSVVSNSLRPHEPQHASPPYPSPTPRVHPNSCPLSWWCHPTISSSVVPFSSCLQSFPSSGAFQMSQFFTSWGQSIRVSTSTSVLPMNIWNWFPLGWTGWISLQSKGLSRVLSSTTVQKHQFFRTQLSLQSNSYIMVSAFSKCCSMK